MSSARGALAVIVTVAITGCGRIAPEPPATWKVDVVPGDKPMIVSISTADAAWMWLVPAGPPAVLLARPSALSGGIELIDPVDCRLHDAEQLQPTSFTIRIIGPLPDRTDYQLQLDPDAPVEGTPTVGFTAQCSG